MNNMNAHLLVEVTGTIHFMGKNLIDLASEKGASSWLTSLPLKRGGFRLNKQQWYDSISIRYNLQPNDTPNKCACGKDYSINHCLTCKKGGFVHFGP